MSIIIGADIVPTEENESFFESGNIDSFVDVNILNILNESCFRIFNLECPLYDKDTPISKCGPALKAKATTINGIKKIGVNLLTIANNHIMDHGYDGLKSTIRTLESRKIDYIGAGTNLEEAAKPFIKEINKKKIGIYACAEHEFSIADDDHPGANPFDCLESFEHVVKLKEQCDYVIVLYHGGKEYYRYPSPMLQKICRKFIKSGANLVVCQHSHCIGCEEKYLSGTIVYGQGNFIFRACKKDMAQTSILIKIDDSMGISYIPLVTHDNGIRLAQQDEETRILSDFHNRGKQIIEKGFVKEEYKKFAQQKLAVYAQTFSGYSHKFFQRLLNKLSGQRMSKYFGFHSYKKHEILAMQNFIECESHRELFLAGLKETRE